MPACHLGPDRLWALRERVREIAESARCAGIVITHGTDTIEETAYLLARTLPPAVPVAITGAMRTSSDEGWDGPRNLLDAARVAASPASAGRGAMVVFHGRIFAGRDGGEDPRHRSGRPSPRRTRATGGMRRRRRGSCTTRRPAPPGAAMRPAGLARGSRWSRWSSGTTARCSTSPGRSTTGS